MGPSVQVLNWVSSIDVKCSSAMQTIWYSFHQVAATSAHSCEYVEDFRSMKPEASRLGGDVHLRPTWFRFAHFAMPLVVA
jgi:hypothetical protein